MTSASGSPGRRYVGDITYLPLEDGTNLYLASCIDLGSRKLAGWAMAGHMRVGLVEDALRAAWRERGSLTDAVRRAREELGRRRRRRRGQQPRRVRDRVRHQTAWMHY